MRLLSWIGLKQTDDRRFYQLAPIFFLAGLINVIGLLSSKTLFITRFGLEYLPAVYLAEAVILPAQLLLTSHLGRRVSRIRLVGLMNGIISLGLTALVLGLGLMMLLGQSWRWYYPVAFLLYNVMLRMYVPVLWMLADGACPLQQAKRLFPVLTAVFILGGALAGLVMSRLASAVPGVGTELTLFLMLALVIVAFPLWIRVLRQSLPDSEPGKARARNAGILEVLHQIRLKPLFRFALASFVVAMAMYYLVDYEMFAVLTDQVSAEHEIGQFYGNFIAALYVGSLLASLLANRLFTRLGLGLTSVLMGLLTVLVFVTIAISQPLPGILAILVTSDIVMDILAFTLVPTISQFYFKLLPERSRAAAGLLYAGAINSGGKLISSAFSGLHARGLVSLLGLSMIGLIFSGLYLAWSRKQKKHYIPALLDSLEQGVIDPGRALDQPVGKLFQADQLARLLKDQDLTNPGRIRVILELGMQLEDPELAPAAESFLNHPDARIRLLAWQTMRPVAGRTQRMRSLLPAALEDQDPAIRLEAVSQLASPGLAAEATESMLVRLLEDPDPEVAAMVRLVLVRLNPVSWQEKIRMELPSWLSRPGGIRIACRLAETLGGREITTLACEKLIQSEQDLDRQRLVECLGRIGAVETAACLADLYPMSSRTVQQSIETALMSWSALPDWKNWQHQRAQETVEGLLLSVKCLPERMYRESQDLVTAACLDHLAGLAWIESNLEHVFKDLPLRYARILKRRLGEIARALFQLVFFALQRQDAAFPLDRMLTWVSNGPRLELAPDKRDQLVEILMHWSRRQPLAAGLVAYLLSGGPDGQNLQDPTGLSTLFTDRWLELARPYWIRDNFHLPFEQRSKEVTMSKNKQPDRPHADVSSWLELISWLGEVDLFAGLSVDELGQLARIGKEVVLEEDAILFAANERPDRLWILVEGFVETSAELGQGQTGSLGLIKAPASLGEEAVLGERASPATAQVVMGPAKFFTLPRTAFRQMIRHYPDIALSLLDTLSVRLLNSQRLFISRERQ